jgi:hypothetical protein
MFRISLFLNKKKKNVNVNILLGLALSIGPNRAGLPEDGDRTQFPKRSVLRKKQDGFLDKDKTMDNVREHSNHIDLPPPLTFRSYLGL